MWDTIKGLDDVKKNHWKAFAFGYRSRDGLLQDVDVVDGGERGAEARLGVVEEVCCFKEAREALLDDAL